MFTKKKAQSTLEYAVIIVVVVAAILAINIYMKRGVQGKLRESTDQIGEQFDPENTALDITRSHIGTTTQTVEDGVTTSTTTGDTRTESGSETVAPWTAPTTP